MKKIKNFLLALALFVTSIGYGMIPGRPRGATYVRPLSARPSGYLTRLANQEKPQSQQISESTESESVTIFPRIPGYGRISPLGNKEFNALADYYGYYVNNEALKQTITILKDQREEAEKHYNQNNTRENLDKLTIIDLALNRLEDPNTNTLLFGQLQTSKNQPEIVLIKEILNPILLQRTQNLLNRYSLDATELLVIQNTWFKNELAREFEHQFAVRKLQPSTPEKKSTLVEFAKEPQKFILQQGYLSTKDMPKKIAEPSAEAEEMYAQSLGEGSGKMPRTYNFTWPQSRSMQKPIYNPAPKSAEKALEQEERFGIGGYQ